MLNVKFYSDKYRWFRYDFKDSIVDERRFNYPMEKKGISLSVPKGYSLFYSY